MTSHNNYLAAFSKLVLPTISKAQRLLSICLESEIKQHDLTLAEFRIVGLLMGEEKGYSQKELAIKLGISAPSLSVSIANLENKHWIERIADAKDLRIKRIKIARGADFAGIADVITALEKQATSGISQKDLKTTQAVLNKIIININALNTNNAKES
jgi:DNA-binding MarR family transcriptional regulator